MSKEITNLVATALGCIHYVGCDKHTEKQDIAKKAIARSQETGKYVHPKELEEEQK